MPVPHIFATNTFNANAISMEDYGMQEQVRNINLAAGKLAREVADGFMAEHPDRTIFVAGSIGPTNKTASMSPDVSDPAYRLSPIWICMTPIRNRWMPW